MKYEASMTKSVREFNQQHRDQYIQREVKSMQKARAKGHRDFKNMTDAQIQEAAEVLARIYNIGSIYK